MERNATKGAVAVATVSLIALCAAWAAQRNTVGEAGSTVARTTHVPATIASATSPRLDMYTNTAVAAHYAIAAALLPSAAGADPLQVEPRVERASGTPCVQTILSDKLIVRFSEQEPVAMIPATPCPGPYSKVKVIVELTGPRENADPSGNIQLFYDDFNGNNSGTIWAGSTQITDDIALWHFERDVTEISKIFTRPQGAMFPGSFDNDYLVFEELQAQVRSVKLVFYRGNTTTPAQRVADEVFPLTRNEDYGNNAFFNGTLPRNAIQVYADVYAQILGTNQRIWANCAPDASFTAFPLLHTPFALGDAHSIFGDPPHGCNGGAFREVEVLIDGTLAGLAPVFPWLPSNMTNAIRNTVNDPAPGVQALNFIPFRIDLTPFAGRLNNGAVHEISLRVAGVTDEQVFVAGQLIVYTDHARAIVPGAVTNNTLAAANPTETNTLAQTTFTCTWDSSRVCHHLTGTVTTRSRRDFRIDGYVDTSRGRIRSSVIQSNRFTNAVTWDVTGPQVLNSEYEGSFQQAVRLASNVDRTSYRTLGSTLLSEDKIATSYPLIIDWFQDGRWITDGEQSGIAADNIRLDVHQARSIRTAQTHRGTPQYTTRLLDVFDGRHHWADALPTGMDTDWTSSRDYLFTDNRGGCYSAGLTTAFGELQTRTRGDACPGGNNGLRWWSHPDGSPDSMGWAPAP